MVGRGSWIRRLFCIRLWDLLSIEGHGWSLCKVGNEDKIGWKACIDLLKLLLMMSLKLLFVFQFRLQLVPLLILGMLNKLLNVFLTGIPSVNCCLLFLVNTFEPIFAPKISSRACEKTMLIHEKEWSVACSSVVWKPCQSELFHQEVDFNLSVLNFSECLNNLGRFQKFFYQDRFLDLHLSYVQA